MPLSKIQKMEIKSINITVSHMWDELCYISSIDMKTTFNAFSWNQTVT